MTRVRALTGRSGAGRLADKGHIRLAWLIVVGIVAAMGGAVFGAFLVLSN